MKNQIKIFLLISLLFFSCASGDSSTYGRYDGTFYRDVYILIENNYYQVYFEYFDFAPTRIYVIISGERHYLKPPVKFISKLELESIIDINERNLIKSRIPNSLKVNPRTGIDWIDQIYILSTNVSDGYKNEKINVNGQVAILQPYDTNIIIGGSPYSSGVRVSSAELKSITRFVRIEIVGAHTGLNYVNKFIADISSVGIRINNDSFKIGEQVWKYSIQVNQYETFYRVNISIIIPLLK